MIRLSMLGLAYLTFENPLSAATSVNITNDWASAQVRVVSPKPPTTPPPGYSWSGDYEGQAVTNLSLNQTGLDPIYNQPFTGTASARIGPTIGLNSGLTSAPGYTQMFGSFLLADDTQGCEAEATLASTWTFSVTGEPAPFYARGFVEMGHSMDFTLQDLTTGLDLVSLAIRGFNGFGEFGTLEPEHDYRLTLNQRALFGEGDGQVGFGFGFGDPVTMEFSNERSHIAIPETSSMSLLAFGALLLARRKRD